MNKSLILATAFLLMASLAPLAVSGQKSDQAGKVIQLTSAEFKTKVFNWEKNPENWVFEGKLPCIVDFYADWCKPCKLVAPIMDELAEKYKGKIVIYKVNTDKEREVSSVFGIRSIPSMLFCPMQGKPQMSSGALPKESYEQVIEEFLLGKKKTK
jgi:thioredoxin